MDGLLFREAYWDDRIARAAFQDFVQSIHGLDFAAWEEAGHWDDAYRPFTWFDPQGSVVSSVCVYSLDFVVDGTPMRGAQISGVGTAQAYRRRGLNRDLTERAMAWARDTHDFFFLFADEDAILFYQRCGFDAVEEHIPSVAVLAGSPHPDLRPLDMDNPVDRALLLDAARRRAPVSQRFGVLSVDLLMFHALDPLRETLYAIEPLDAVVAARHADDELRIYDVIAPHMPTWAELAPYLTGPEDTRATFFFSPDALQVEGATWAPLLGNDLHDRGDIPLRGQDFLFPFTAHA